MEIIAISNQKGGSGKTTTTINLASCLCQLGKRVLTIDFDPQYNLSRGLGVNAKDIVTVKEYLFKGTKLDDVVCKIELLDGLELLPANIGLADAELELANIEHGRENLLKKRLEDSKLNYDYILIDCNPALGLLTINALVAAHSIIIPMDAGVFSFEGISNLLNVVQKIKKKLNKNLFVRGVLLTKANQTKLSKDFEKELKNTFGERAFKTVIHQNVTIGEAQIVGLPINLYDDKSKGYEDYMSLAKEIITNGKQ